MLEITGNDISELSDSDLRSLIGLLCEAELRSIGLPTAGVTWGGHQDAKDGGIDVRVELTTNLHSDGFVPRSRTCFQVKKPDMPRAAIISEMRPNGLLREVIKDLVDAHGAYIIVSSQGSTADFALKGRKEAMQEALSDCPNASNIKVDFYDRERIAGWVRSHLALVLWVRDKIGRPIQGWRTYENWSRCPGGIEEEYLLDEHIRLHSSSNPHAEGLSVETGINEIRNTLERPGSSVRLVGLSGVGKTRLLQSLFDERVGEKPLNQSQVFYSDISDSPTPDPRNFAERIIAFQKPAILAIDNCPPDLHRRLTSVCSASGSLVSLITVEYDVREDQPEETEVFRLEPASTELIEKVISARFSHINQVNARTIAEFSGGNARIAIALANTVKRDEDLAQLRDSELFNRLFQQRNEPNSSLLRAAEACSLVYSFDSRTTDGVDIELKILGSLVGMSVREIYKSISELKRRDLVQQRSIWRAVLPHAIANKLAQRALENIPLDNICNAFEKATSERLLKSFSRRLGYLHECEAAKEISKRWLSKNGLLANINNLNELGMNLFKNIAPINPEATLSAIEGLSEGCDGQRFFSRQNVYYLEFTRLLRSLAYDKELFERSVELLCRFALSESLKENNNSIRELLKSLFYIYLSGTHATPSQRLRIISNLVESNFEDQNILGMSLLEASLESWHFSSHHRFEFGARARDYGFSPRNRDEIHQWFKIFIEYIVNIAVSDLSVAHKAKAILAEKFRGLWIKAGMHDELETAVKEISSKGTWKEGWLAVKKTKRFDGKKMNPEVFARLNELDMLLEPTTLVERAKLYALSRHYSSLDSVDAIEEEEVSDSYRRVEGITRELGCEVASNDDIFKELLPEFLSSDGIRLFSFGQGLADGCANPQKIWQNFREQLSFLNESERNYQVLCGFLNAISEINSDILEMFLDEAVTDNILAFAYPLLQSSVEISVQGFERIKQSLEHGTVPIWQYRNLACRIVQENVSDENLCELLRLISSKPEGIVVSIDILYTRIYNHPKEDALSNSIISLGQEFLLEYQFLQKDNRINEMDYALSNIIKSCFVGESSKESARLLCNKLIQTFINDNIYFIYYGDVIKELAIAQPVVFLDTFLGQDARPDRRIERMFSKTLKVNPNPMSYIDDDVIIEWCEESPKTRYPLVASVIIPYTKCENNALLEWTPLALNIITNCSDPIVVLNEFKLTFRPMSWSGSRANIMQSRLKLILDLKKHENSFIAEWACKEERVFEKEISSEREWELKQENNQNERFE